MNLKNRWIFFSLTYLYVIALYLITNRLTFVVARQLPMTSIDVTTPFLPWTAFIYVSVYIFPLTVGILVNRDEDVKPIVLSYVAMATICTLVFAFYPTVYPRPAIVNHHTGAFVLQFVRFLDTPANCMPSQHVALGFLSAFYVQRYNRRLGNLGLILGILIAFSTLTTKQHYVWDVIAGYFLARLTYVAASATMSTPEAVAR